MKTKLKYCFWMLSILLLTSASYIEAEENKAYLKDGKIVVETKDGVRTVDYSSEKEYPQASSKEWNIKEKISPVDEALAVYKNKFEPLYNHKIHFYGQSDGDVEYFIEYLSDYEDSRYLLSPHGNYLYYLGRNSDGEKYVSGHNLKENTQFSVGSGNDFYLVACNEDTSFVIVQQGQADLYDVFDAQGKKISTIVQPGVFEEIQDKIKKAVCI